MSGEIDGIALLERKLHEKVFFLHISLGCSGNILTEERIKHTRDYIKELHANDSKIDFEVKVTGRTFSEATILLEKMIREKCVEQRIDPEDVIGL